MSGAAPSIVEMRPMGIGDILDATFRLYKVRFLSFVVIALVAYLPYALWTLGVGLAYPAAIPEYDPFAGPANMHREYAGQTGGDIGYALLNLSGTWVFLLIVLPLAQAALIYNISGTILGDRLSAGASFSRAAGRLLPLLGTQFLVGIVVVLGLLLLIVPGIYFSIWFMLVAPVVVLERLGGTRGMSRSRALMKGNVGKGFALMLVVSVLGMIVNFGAGFVLAALPLPHPALMEVGLLIVQAVVLPIQTAPVILLYYELRVRKEAFDLQLLAESVGTAPLPTPARPPPPAALG